MGAVIVGAWLVEAKQSVIENMAPVLTRLFTPLFAAVLLAFLVTMVWTGSGIDVEREVLIGFDLLLALVLGLLLYAVSARDPHTPPDAFDALQFLLVVSALVVDGVALAAIAGRISEFGFSPNRVAALGEKSDPARQPCVVGLAVRALPGRPRPLLRPGTLADRLPAGLCGLGRLRRRLPAAVRLRLEGLNEERAHPHLKELSLRSQGSCSFVGLSGVDACHFPSPARLRAAPLPCRLPPGED